MHRFIKVSGCKKCPKILKRFQPYREEETWLSNISISVCAWQESRCHESTLVLFLSCSSILLLKAYQCMSLGWVLGKRVFHCQWGTPNSNTSTIYNTNNRINLTICRNPLLVVFFLTSYFLAVFGSLRGTYTLLPKHISFFMT